MMSHAFIGKESEKIYHRKKRPLEMMECTYNLGSLGLLSVSHDPVLGMELSRLQSDAVEAEVGRAQQLLASPPKLNKRKK